MDGFVGFLILLGIGLFAAGPVAMVNRRPTSVLHSILTPNWTSLAISASMTGSGRRNSGMP